MAHYRFYLMDAADRIMHASDLEADDDAQAIELLCLRGEQTDVELWCGKRKVASLPKGGPITLSASTGPPSSDDAQTS